MNIGLAELTFIVLLIIKLLEIAAISWWLVIGIPLLIALIPVILVIIAAVRVAVANR